MPFPYIQASIFVVCCIDHSHSDWSKMKFQKKTMTVKDTEHLKIIFQPFVCLLSKTHWSASPTFSSIGLGMSGLVLRPLFCLELALCRVGDDDLVSFFYI